MTDMKTNPTARLALSAICSVIIVFGLIAAAPFAPIVRNEVTTNSLALGPTMELDTAVLNVESDAVALRTNAAMYATGNFYWTILDDGTVWAIRHGDPATMFSTLNVGVTVAGNGRLRLNGANYRDGSDPTEYTEFQNNAFGLQISPALGGISMNGNLLLGANSGAVPSYPLQFGEEVALSTIPVIIINRELAGESAGNWHGLAFNDRIQYTTSGHGWNNIDMWELITGDADYDHHAGIQWRPQYSGGGTIGPMYGFWTLPVLDGGGAVDAVHSIFLRQPTVSGGTTLATNILVDIGAATAGSVTNLSLLSRGDARFLATIGDVGGDWSIDADGVAEFASVSAGGSDLVTAINAKEDLLVNSAGLAAALSDETGTGGNVHSNAPHLNAPTMTAPEFTGGMTGDSLSLDSASISTITTPWSVLAIVDTNMTVNVSGGDPRYIVTNITDEVCINVTNLIAGARGSIRLYGTGAQLLICWPTNYWGPKENILGRLAYLYSTNGFAADWEVREGTESTNLTFLPTSW